MWSEVAILGRGTNLSLECTCRLRIDVIRVIPVWY